mgnify:CR=1 FL=1
MLFWPNSFNKHIQKGPLYSSVAQRITADIISDIIANFIEALTLKPIVATKMKAILDGLFGRDINEISASYSAKKVSNANVQGLITGATTALNQ